MALKGISPLVATIMLIAFTLIIAGIISAFVVNFSESQQNQIKSCMDARVNLLRASYDSGAKNMTLTIHNDGKVDLRFQIILEYSNTTLHKTNATEIYRTAVNVTAGVITVFDVENVEADLDRVTIKSTRCERPCSECPGAMDSLSYSYISGLR